MVAFSAAFRREFPSRATIMRTILQRAAGECQPGLIPAKAICQLNELFAFLKRFDPKSDVLLIDSLTNFDRGV